MTAAPLNNEYAKRLQRNQEKRVRDAAPDLLAAAKLIRKEIGGMWSAFDYDLRSAMGNTNYQVMLDHMAAFDAVVAKAEGRQ